MAGAGLDYDPTTPTVLQNNAWSCSCATTTWYLQSLGFAVTYGQIKQQMLEEHLVSVEDGLLVGNGQPLARWLRDAYGLAVEVNSDADWDWVVARAGAGPLALGGHRWNHWSGVRLVNAAAELALANPAPSWQGVEQAMDPNEFARWGGPWAALFTLAGAKGESMADQELQQKYNDLVSWTSSLCQDTLRPTVADLEQLARDIQRPKAARDQALALADRLRPFVEEA